jgi:xanthine dehydrogenase iron-sulfur cluster and FAD-binding subunit A
VSIQLALSRFDRTDTPLAPCAKGNFAFDYPLSDVMQWLAALGATEWCKAAAQRIFPMSDIFIRYARGDEPRAEMLAKALEWRGWSIFWDRTIPTGKT